MIDEVLLQEIIEQFHEQRCFGPLKSCELLWEHEFLARDSMEILDAPDTVE